MGDCMTSGIAAAYFGPVVPVISSEVKKRLPRELWEITERFCKRYGGS